MLFYDSANPAPNPRRVRIFLAEKGVTVPTTDVSIPRREQKAEAYLRVNPLGQTPALELDDGTVLTESLAICRYFEALHPEPPLFGTGAEGMAAADMWTRRVELRLMVPVSMFWVHSHPLTARLPMRRFPEYGETQADRAKAAMGELDRFLADREWLDGLAYSVADIALLTTVDFAGFIGVEVPEDLGNLKGWHARASARPSAAA